MYRRFRMQESEDHIKSAAAWSLGQIGRHTSEHAKILADENVLSCLVSLYVSDKSSEDLKAKCKRSLELVLENLTEMPALDSLLQEPDASEDIIQIILAQIAKVIPNDPKVFGFIFCFDRLVLRLVEFSSRLEMGVHS